MKIFFVIRTEDEDIVLHETEMPFVPRRDEWVYLPNEEVPRHVQLVEYDLARCVVRVLLGGPA
jgi:hypothetical protein